MIHKLNNPSISQTRSLFYCVCFFLNIMPRSDEEKKESGIYRLKDTHPAQFHALDTVRQVLTILVVINSRELFDRLVIKSGQPSNFMLGGAVAFSFLAIVFIAYYCS